MPAQMASDDKRSVVEDLEMLNEIAGALIRNADVRGALERALGRLIDVVGLETGWIFLYDESDTDRWWGKQFTLVAHHNLPPAMSLDSADAWKRNCECQSLCKKGKLTAAYNEVTRSRLAVVRRRPPELSVHARRRCAREPGVGHPQRGRAKLGRLQPARPRPADQRRQPDGCRPRRARLFDMLHERRVHEQASLLDFSNQLLSRLDLDDLLNYLVEEVRRLLQMDACAVLLPDEDDPSYLRFYAAAGWYSDPVAEQRRVPADDRSGSGLVMRTQQPIVLEDAEIREEAPWMANWLPAEGFLSAGIVPLIADGRSIGALVADMRQLRLLQDDEMRFLQLMANQAALAIEKARLHREEIQRQRLEGACVARQIQLGILPSPRPPFPAGRLPLAINGPAGGRRFL